MRLKISIIFVLIGLTSYTLSYALPPEIYQLEVCACTVPVLSYVPSLHEFSSRWLGQSPVIIPADTAGWGLHKAHAALGDMLDTSEASHWHTLPVTLAASNSYSCTCTDLASHMRRVH